MSKKANYFIKRLVQFSRTVWFFPVVLGFLFLIPMVFQIHGSSISVYHEYFYGDTRQDKNLLFSQPRAIRSDEWLVNTQKTLAQEREGYPSINENVANGEDQSVIYDTPYREWSIIFKPHNWSFLALPFDYAFAAKWWVMGYLLIIGVYFFVLSILPKRRLLASILALGLFFSPFIQWWYQYGTLGPIYCGLFASVLLIALLKAKTLKSKIFLSLGFSYVITSFILILYPPFQIACALAIGAFLAGFLISNRKELLTKQKAIENWSFAGVGLALSALMVSVFLLTRLSVILAIQNTVYPGTRIVAGGGFDIIHLFSSHLSPLFQSTVRASKYMIGSGSLHHANQSEASNFLLITPFLILPILVLLYRAKQKKHKTDWPLLITTGLFILLLARLKTVWLDFVFNVLLLDKVPTKRLIIGIGLLGFINLVLFIKHLAKLKRAPFDRNVTILYCAAVYGLQIFFGFYAVNRSPGFITPMEVMILSLPITIALYFFMTKKLVIGGVILLLFSISTTFMVNPLYKGTAIITDNEVINKIETISDNQGGLWAAESGFLQNFGVLAGAGSLSGVYYYPQPEIWEDIGADANIYNRYAHVDFAFDENPNIDVNNSLVLVANDHFTVVTEPCGKFLRDQNVKFLLTEKNLESETCASLIETFQFPKRTINIYRLDGSVSIR